MVNLYKPENTDYSMNGDHVLQPTKCELTAELNGKWVLDLECPNDKAGVYKDITSGAVIGVPTWYSEKQLFRIRSVSKGDFSVEAKAYPIFMDSADDLFFMDTRPTNCTGKAALAWLLQGQTKYKGNSDIERISTAYYIRKNLIEALESDDDQSFLNRWGGELYYDNYTVNINYRVGRDNGMRVTSAFNSTGMTCDVDDTDVVTRIVPVAANERMLSGSSQWIDSPIIKDYPVIHTKTITFDNIVLKADLSGDGEGKTICNTQADLDAALKKACQDQFNAGLDKPTVNYRIDLLDVSRSPEYADIKGLVSVALGDTVHCLNTAINIHTDSRVIKVVYDCVNRQNESVELGEFTYNYFSEMKSSMQKVENITDADGNVKGETVRGIINGMRAALRVQQTAAERQESRAILFEDTDPNSSMYGAMCLGTQGFQIAKSKDSNGDWIWSTFGTANGFYASLIVTGLLASKNFDPNNPTKEGFGWNLDTGDLYANNGHFTGKFESNGSRFKTVINDGSMTVYSGSKQVLTFAPIQIINGSSSYYILGIQAPGSKTVYLALDGDTGEAQLNCTSFKMGGQKGLTGKANFNDGTYMTFKNGILVGGKTSQGEIA